jgi:hypothetical protein
MKKGVAQTMLSSLVLMIVTSIGLALLLNKVGPSSWMSGAKTGLVAGVCFSAASIGINYLYEKKPLGLFLINAGYAIAGSVLAGIILSVWK